MKYILLDALLTKIEKRKKEWSCGSSTEAKYKVEAYKEVIELLNTLEVKEVDLEKEIRDHIRECLDVKFPTTDIELIKKDVAYTAKKFFELGMRVSNPITAQDRGTAEENNELTWEDIDWIVGEAVCRVSEDSEAEQICKEVLERFLKERKGK